jgi:serine/threonine protein kinase
MQQTEHENPKSLNMTKKPLRAMDSQLINEMKAEFQERDERLLDFCETKPDSTSIEEKKALLPILNSLKKNKDRYEELGIIAEGGEKRITRVYDSHLNRHVAMARAVNAKTREEQEQFLREAHLEANFAHPNIVPVYNIGIDPEGIPFFTMELISGDSLKEIIQKLREGDASYKRDYPLDILLNMYLKVCDAIAYAHARHVLHLDIKPDNIRVGKFGEVFICDWGLARVIHQDQSIRPEIRGELDGDILNNRTLSGIIKGTPGFMAPEQAIASGEKTIQTDIYALGALLYMLLTYELPVKGNSGNEMLEETRSGKIIPPHNRKKNNLIPRSLAAVAMKALSLKPENRYTDVNALQKEISRYLSGFPTTAERTRIISVLSLLVKRHNLVASLILFFLLVIAIIVSINLVVIRKEKATAVIARERAENNFSLYKAHQEKAIKLEGELTKTTQFAIQTRDYSKPWHKIQILELALKNIADPELRLDLIRQKGTMYFVLQEFHQANQCFEAAGHGSHTDNTSWELSKKFAKIKPNDKELLNLQQLGNLLSGATYNNDAINYLYFHHMQRAQSIDPEQYLPVAEEMLNLINRINRNVENIPLRLEKRDNGYHLDLTQSPYILYTLREIGRPWENILEPLRPYSMDISHLPLRSLNELKKLQVHELRMVGLNISRQGMLVKNLKQMGVKKLIIDTAAYRPHVVPQLHEICEVVNETFNPLSFHQALRPD